MSQSGETASSTEPLDEHLAQCKSLMQQGNFAGAESMMQALTPAHPDNEALLYHLAVSQRYLAKYQQAHETLLHLKRVSPGYGRAWQEQGHLFLTQQKQAEALAAYRQAVARNNSLIASWRAIVDLARAQGMQDVALRAQDQYHRLAALPEALLGVRNMMAEGKLLKAEKLCRRFMQQNQKHVEGMRLLADLGVKTNVLDDAEFLLESALVFEPDNLQARFDYMNVLYKRQKFERSFQEAKKLLTREPQNDTYKTAYANQSMALGRFNEAIDIYNELLKKPTPGNEDRSEVSAGLQLVLGHALKTVGRLDEAIQSYRQSYQARQDFGDAWWSLANLKTYRFTADEIRKMQQYEADENTHLDDRIHFCFALGKAFEDAEDYDRASDYYLSGNALKKTALRYSAERMTAQLHLHKQYCTREFFQQRSHFGHDAADPLFIVGLPRAGSTLLEQILASHSLVDGTLELQNIPALAGRLDGRRLMTEAPKYPAALHDLDAARAKQFGEAFVSDTRIHRQGAPFFTDKMPNNFRHIGLIHLILPNARIIDARRHPMACCFSGFKQLFAEGQEFTYGLHEIGQYYRDYVELMEHWEQVLPGKVLRVNYEEVVADLETQVRRILEFCDLPFEEACVNYHQTERSVRTPSSEQVRQPIFTEGLEQWRHFEARLDPLKEALGALLTRYPISSSE